ncbi:MAG: DUF6883 domain-containing protein [Planctomycetota bacterium]|jgi:hypothetical protein
MKFRDGESAVVDIAKLRLYCLDPHHPRGAPKARQFASRLGLCASDAESLQQQLLAAARKSDEVVAGQRDEYGQLCDLDVEITGPDGSGTVHSTWIVGADESPPRLVTCHVL